MNSSEAPRLARPISCEKSAKSWSAKSGTWPRSSWQMSGSGVYSGQELWRMYCVEWKTLKARPAKKSLGDRRPATGRRLKPVQSVVVWDKNEKLIFQVIALLAFR